MLGVFDHSACRVAVGLLVGLLVVLVLLLVWRSAVW